MSMASIRRERYVIEILGGKLITATMESGYIGDDMEQTEATPLHLSYQFSPQTDAAACGRMNVLVKRLSKIIERRWQRGP